MRRVRRYTLVLAAASVTWTGVSRAAVLCQNGRSGVVAVRAGCKKKDLQLSPSRSCTPGYPVDFPDAGNWTPVLGSSPPSPGVYAVSIPGVPPSACITWFQANQACLLAGKRLLTNREWQGGAAGTPDPGTDNGDDGLHGQLAGAGEHGLAIELQIELGRVRHGGECTGVGRGLGGPEPGPTRCTDWTSEARLPGGDFSCFGGPGGSGASALPGALVRGGEWDYGPIAGVFAVDASLEPWVSADFIRFRCAR
jgi:formylglycine-generating enzyme required for sulfatase activity